MRSPLRFKTLIGLFLFSSERRQTMWRVVGLIMVEFIEYLVQRSRGSGRGGDF